MNEVVIIYRKNNSMLMQKPILQVLHGLHSERTPIWFMRQAGRYLPEYREIRSGTKSFMDAVLSPEIAAEITMQPIRRFDLDAAIVFSDILVLPYAMGVPVDFKEGIGPVLNFELDINNPTSPLLGINSRHFKEVIGKISQTVTLVKAMLRKDYPHVGLIGFAGAPWTVLCYMLEKDRKKGSDFEQTRRIAYQHKEAFKVLIKEITEATISFLSSQIEAGAEVVKIFDSHAGILGENEFAEFVISPTLRIVEEIRSKYPEVPIIGFPRKAGVLYENFVEQTKINCVAVDHTLPITFIQENLQTKCVIQGNLDNIWLTVDLEGAQSAMDQSIDSLLTKLNNSSPGRFIFNLGHGCLPNSKIENIQHIIKKVRFAS